MSEKWALTPNAPADGYGFIQWKGTDVCLDFDCLVCKEADPSYRSYGLHFDGEFAYALQCPDCDTIYELSAKIGYRKVEGLDSQHNPKVAFK